MESASFDVGRQSAGAINNVGRDQYQTYVAHIQSQRDSFMRDVAATRTKARWLVWLGLLLMAIGFALMLWVMSGHITGMIEIVQITDPSGAREAFERLFAEGLGKQLFGVPVVILSVSVAGLGQLLLVVGIVLHFVATARRKRVDRELAVPAPWTFPQR